MKTFPIEGLQAAIDYHATELLGTQRTIEKLREGLKGRCDHPKTEVYRWEHDNGYGRQTMINGRRCWYCLYVDLWNRGSFIDPAQVNE